MATLEVWNGQDHCYSPFKEGNDDKSHIIQSDYTAIICMLEYKQRMVHEVCSLQ